MMAAISFFLSLAALSVQVSGVISTDEGFDSLGEDNLLQLIPPPTSPAFLQSPSINELANIGSTQENLSPCPTEVCGVEPFDEKTGHTTGPFIQICKCSGGRRCLENAACFFLRSYKTYVCAPLYRISSDTPSSKTYERSDL